MNELEKLKGEFINPSEEFTPIPFWFWNGHLTEKEIVKQIHDFYDKGVMGFVLHPRLGIPKEIEYLSDIFMELVHVAVSEAKKLGMTVILYDEGMYPSGSANGQVVRENPKFASRGLKMVEHPCKVGENQVKIELLDDEEIVSIQAVEKITDTSIKPSNTVLLQENNGKVAFTPPNSSNWSILLFVETYSKGTIRGIHYGEDDGEENAPASSDLLNPEAVNTYIRLTHDKYYSVLKDFFGSTVIAMFTDEPDMLGRNSLPNLKPWTRDFLAYYTSAGNEEVNLPALWFDAGAHGEEVRKLYRKTINQRLTEAYYKPISDWCSTHGISLTGHPAASDDIGLLEYFQIPGQDVVWRWVAPEKNLGIEGHHSTAGKCSSDAARHRGRRRNLNEVLGVCGIDNSWNLSAGDMKWYFDWLLIRGVNLISPHAFYYSIEGKSRSHERPPDVGRNNSWWPYYKQFAQYIKRMSWIMTDSVNTTEIAVLCEEDHLPWKIVKPLFENQIEFNYLEESLFLTETKTNQGKLVISEQQYTTILVEDTKHLETEVITALERFIDEGGLVITLENTGVNKIKGSLLISAESEIISVLDRQRERQVVLSPSNKDIRISKVVKSDKTFYVVVNEGEENYEGNLSISEVGMVEKWDAWKGTINEVGVQKFGDSIAVPMKLNRRESIIYSIEMNENPELLGNETLLSDVKRMEINEDWKISHAPIGKKSLQSWTEWKGMEHFSGSVTYETSFTLNKEELQYTPILDLGDVYEIADVTINGVNIGVKMWAPYEFQLQENLLKIGENTLHMKVINNKANEMDEVSLKSGLLGPVSLNLK
ncbi:glycosylhydrolase-like jelly roll fold domain-containing protein [Evansella sp. AB-rgal1]|uniref:glycosylhydrolase-like jelly roll fold domain-containing protein n=1 Tax=Evansella sp. AB-rgal1 TaxID=3242696 RepID=UPI00359EB56D